MSALVCSLHLLTHRQAGPGPGLGDDANACSLSAPCKTFAGAISKTAAGGDRLLRSRRFGAVTITKAMMIDCSGTFGSALAAGLSGVIIVNAGAGDAPAWHIDQRPRHQPHGIRFLIGAQLSVENCLISGFTGSGIDINVTSNAEVFITNTHITKAGTGFECNVRLLSVAVNNVTVAGPTTHGLRRRAGRRHDRNTVIACRWKWRHRIGGRRRNQRRQLNAGEQSDRIQCVSRQNDDRVPTTSTTMARTSTLPKAQQLKPTTPTGLLRWCN